MKYKKYDSYSEYIEHQGSKMELLISKNLLAKSDEELKEFIKNQADRYKEEINNISNLLNKKPVLCLGARVGIEVVAWRNEGYINSIGIDVNPKITLEDNLVICGDFQNIPFKDNEYENVYTNAIDHCSDINKVINEIKRVLLNNGHFILRCSDKCVLGSYESCGWDNLNEIINLFKENNFELIYKKKFNIWRSDDYLLLFKNIK